MGSWQISIDRKTSEVNGVRCISTISGEQIRRLVPERQSVPFQGEYRQSDTHECHLPGSSRRRFHFGVDSFAKLDPSPLHFVAELEPHPEAFLHAEETR